MPSNFGTIPKSQVLIKELYPQRTLGNQNVRRVILNTRATL